MHHLVLPRRIPNRVQQLLQQLTVKHTSEGRPTPVVLDSRDDRTHVNRLPTARNSLAFGKFLIRSLAMIVRKMILVGALPDPEHLPRTAVRHRAIHQ